MVAVLRTSLQSHDMHTVYMWWILMAANGQKTIGEWPGFCCFLILNAIVYWEAKQQSCTDCNYQERPLMSNTEAAKVHAVCLG